MKNLVLTAILFVSLLPFARSQHSRFGVTGGASLSDYRASADGQTSTSKSKMGFSVGVTADIPFSKTFSFQPAFQFLQKGGSEEESQFTLKTTLDYLELPLNFVYKAPGKNGHFLIGLGPSLAFGLSGTQSVSGNGYSSSETIHFGGDGELKGFDFGGNILTGFEWNSGFFVQLNYNLGLSNISPDSESSFKNNYFGLRLGYFFGSRK